MNDAELRAHRFNRCARFLFGILLAYPSGFGRSKRMTNNRRVVITGIGAVTPLGLSIDETWLRLKRGESGVGPITLFDASDLPVRIAGEVKNFNPLYYMARRTARRTSRSSHLALAAAQQAVAEARLDFAAIQRDRIGVSLGTGVGGLDKTI